MANFWSWVFFEELEATTSPPDLCLLCLCLWQWWWPCLLHFLCFFFTFSPLLFFFFVSIGNELSANFEDFLAAATIWSSFDRRSPWLAVLSWLSVDTRRFLRLAIGSGSYTARG